MRRPDLRVSSIELFDVRSRENTLKAASLLSFAKKLRPLPLLNPIEVLASMSGDKTTSRKRGSEEEEEG